MSRYRNSLLALAALTGPAAAQPLAPLVSLTDGRQIESAEQIGVAEKGAFENANGPIRVAGNYVQLAQFSGVLGYSSDVAYLIVASGSARVGQKLARPGQVILLGAYGAAPVISRFDARHYAATLPETARQWAPRVMQGLTAIGTAQRTALFFGLYRHDGARVPTRGEAGRRQVLGAPSVQAARFGGRATSEHVEYDVVTMFVRALFDRDAATLAPLIDPLPFGGAGLDSMGNAARLAYARTIIAATDWPVQLDGVVPLRMSKPGVWVLQAAAGPTFLTLRATRDFVFVQSVQAGEQK
jgi:hypothetical protein